MAGDESRCNVQGCSTYVDKVLKVMEIIAKRVEPKFLAAYESMWGNSTETPRKFLDDRALRIKKAKLLQTLSPKRRALRLNRNFRF